MRKKLTLIDFTREGLSEVKKKYELLKKARPEAVTNLKKARELGDLSENGFYKAARARLSSLDNQLFRLETIIKLARVKNVKSGVVDIGSKVIVDDGKDKKTFQIVGDYEADPLNRKITIKSPIGKGLFGRKEKDTVTVRTPKGINNYRILKIS